MNGRPEARELGVLDPLQQRVPLLPGADVATARCPGALRRLHHHQLLPDVVEVQLLVVTAASPPPPHRRHVCEQRQGDVKNRAKRDLNLNRPSGFSHQVMVDIVVFEGQGNNA